MSGLMGGSCIQTAVSCSLWKTPVYTGQTIRVKECLKCYNENSFDLAQ